MCSVIGAFVSRGMKLTITLAAAIFLLVSASWLSAAPQPFGYNPDEKTEKYFFYADCAFRACKSVNTARVSRGLPELVESPQLAAAAGLLIDHMLREDWAGTTFPSGYSLKNALVEAGYPAGAAVSAAIRVAPYDWANYKENWGYSGQPGTRADVAAKACSVRDGLNPGLTAFGYFTVVPPTDAGRLDGTNPDVPSNGGGHYEVMLFGSVPPVVGERLLVSSYEWGRKYRIRKNTPAASIVIKRGARLSRGIVATPISEFLIGKAKLKGRLPAGVRFVGAAAKFIGKPKRKGTFKVQVTAKYRQRKNVTSVGIDGGVKTISVVLRVR